MATITVIVVTAIVISFHTAKAELNIDKIIKKNHDLANAIRGIPENCAENTTGSGNSPSVSMNVQCKQVRKKHGIGQVDGTYDNNCCNKCVVILFQ